MTNMTHELMKTMHYPEYSGGRTEVSIEAIKKVLQKLDPEGYNSFKPEY
jgi:hypothetical protein